MGFLGIKAGNCLRRTERETLIIDCLGTVIVSLDGCHPILLAGDSAPVVGKSNNVKEFLTAVGGDGDDATLRLQRRHSEDGVRTFLRAVGGVKVGVVVLLEDIYAQG